MNKTLKWVIISLVILIVLLIILKKAGVLGKDEGIKVTAEKAATVKKDVNAMLRINFIIVILLVIKEEQNACQK